VVASLCNKGSVKPAVLPVPVCAAPKQIVPGEHDRDRLRLDRGGLGVALLADSAQQLGLQAK